MPSGFRGVDVFFVISGYVVTASILRHKSENISDYFTAFYKRRILRLMPALLACVLVTTVVGGLFIRPDSFSLALEVGARSLIGWSNNYLIASSSDYFGLGTELNPFTHTWSLGVEEQFYFIFPIILAAVYGLRRRPVQNKKVAVVVLTVLVVALRPIWLISKFDRSAQSLLLYAGSILADGIWGAAICNPGCLAGYYYAFSNTALAILCGSARRSAFARYGVYL